MPATSASSSNDQGRSGWSCIAATAFERRASAKAANRPILSVPLSRIWRSNCIRKYSASRSRAACLPQCSLNASAKKRSKVDASDDAWSRGSTRKSGRASARGLWVAAPKSKEAQTIATPSGSVGTRACWHGLGKNRTLGRSTRATSRPCSRMEQPPAFRTCRCPTPSVPSKPVSSQTDPTKKTRAARDTWSRSEAN